MTNSDAENPKSNWNSNDEVEKLKQTQSLYDEWLTRNSENQKILPIVQANRDFTVWKLEALTHQPDEAMEIPFPNISSSIEAESQYAKNALPPLPKTDLAGLRSASAFNSSGTADVYAHVARVGDIPTQAAQSYSLTYTTKYHQLQQAYDRLANVRALLCQFDDSLALERLEPASRALAASKSEAIDRSAAANSIRNLLHGMKGDLFKLAYGTQAQNKTWKGMAAKLARGGPQSSEYNELARQETIHSNLLLRLGIVLKDREGGSVTNLDVLWTETLNHIYIVLNLIAS